MRRLILCREAHYKGLYPGLWELIWRYLNEYKYLMNAVVLEYQMSLTCDPGLRFHPSIVLDILGLYDWIGNFSLRRVKSQCTTRMYVSNIDINMGPSNFRDLWYNRPITCQGKKSYIKIFDGIVHITGPHEPNLILEATSFVHGPHLSINAVKGRRIIATYKLQPFLEGYIQPEGSDVPMEPPNLVWNLDDNPEGNYEGLQASIEALEPPGAQGRQRGLLNGSQFAVFADMVISDILAKDAPNAQGLVNVINATAISAFGNRVFNEIMH